MEYYTHQNVNKIFNNMLDDVCYIKRSYIVRKNNKFDKK